MTKLMSKEEIRKFNEEQQQLVRARTDALRAAEYLHRDDPDIAELIKQKAAMQALRGDLNKQAQNLQNSMMEIVKALQEKLLPFIDESLR